MKRLFSMRQALEDKNLFASILDGDSWMAHRVLLIASQGEALTPAEREVFRRLTCREREPDEPVHELWEIVGRRGGKTRACAVASSYFAALCDFTDVLAPGERGVIPIMAATQVQARKALSYLSGIFDPRTGPPLLRKLRTGETADSISLSTRVDIEVRPASWRTIRGITAVAAIADEVAYWRSDYSANPDKEILDAVRPALATTGGPLIVISSPYARKGEVFDAFQRHYGPEGDPTVLVAKAASRVMNPSLSERFVARQYERDPAAASAEFGAEFRSDVEAFVTLEAVQACLLDGCLQERSPSPGTRYTAFVDPSGGGADSMTLAISHRDGDIIVLDAVREEYPGANPDAVVERFCALLKTYGIRSVTGDRYAGSWVPERFRQHGVTYVASELSKSDIYRDFLPVLNSQRVRLLNVAKLEKQLVSLERRTSRGTGRDIIDHPQMKGAHDDVANAVAGAVIHAESASKPLIVTAAQAAAFRVPRHGRHAPIPY